MLILIHKNTVRHILCNLIPFLCLIEKKTGAQTTQDLQVCQGAEREGDGRR